MIVIATQKYIPSIKTIFAGLSTGSLKLLSDEFSLLHDVQDIPENKESSPVVGVEFLQREQPQLLVIREHPFSLSVFNTGDGVVEVFRNRLENVERLDQDASLLQYSPPRLSSIDETVAIFSVLCKGILHIFRYAHPESMATQPEYSYTFTEYEWASLLHVCVPENSVSVLTEEPRMDVMCFYEGGASVVINSVEPRVQSSLCESVQLHSSDYPLLLKPETLDHILHEPEFSSIPASHPDAPEFNKVRLLDLLAECDCMELACEFVTRRSGKRFVIRDLTVFLYFADAELRSTEERVEGMEEEFRDLVSGRDGHLTEFSLEEKKVKKRLGATRQLLISLQSRGAVLYSPSQIDHQVLSESFSHWKNRTPPPEGLGGFLSKAKLHEFVSAVVTWTDAELLEAAVKRADELRLKIEVLGWLLKNDCLAGFFEKGEWQWEERVKGRDTIIQEKLTRSTSLSSLSLEFPPSPLLVFQLSPDFSLPPSSLSSLTALLNRPRNQIHFTILYLLRDLCHKARDDQGKLQVVHGCFETYVAELQVEQEMVAKVEGVFLLDLCFDPSIDDRRTSMAESLAYLSHRALASVGSFLTPLEKSHIFQSFYSLSLTSPDELLLWGEYISPDLDTNWPWYLQALIENDMIPKAFQAAEDLMLRDAKRPVYEVFLVVSKGKKVGFEAVYLPWRNPGRFEEALRRVEMEGLIAYFRLARQRYRELGEGMAPFSTVIQRNVPAHFDPSLIKSASPAGRQAPIHRPRLPIENFPQPGSGRALERISPTRKGGKEGGVTPKRLEFFSGQESSASKTGTEEMRIG